MSYESQLVIHNFRVIIWKFFLIKLKRSLIWKFACPGHFSKRFAGNWWKFGFQTLERRISNFLNFWTFQNQLQNLKFKLKSSIPIRERKNSLKQPWIPEQRKTNTSGTQSLNADRFLWNRMLSIWLSTPQFHKLLSVGLFKRLFWPTILEKETTGEAIDLNSLKPADEQVWVLWKHFHRITLFTRKSIKIWRS